MSDNRFGNYAILDAVQHDFEKAPELYWKIRPATARDELAVTKFATKQIPMPDSTPIYRYPNSIEIMFREIATLYAGTNIPTSEGSPLPLTATVDEVEAFLGEMPIEMVREIWRAMGAVMPGWGPEKKALTSKS